MDLMSDKKLFLLDGHALVYRAHYAFITRPLINSKGMNTSAIAGFMRTLWDLIQNQKPTHIAVAFDPSTATFRHVHYPEYKAQREAQPEDITLAIPIIMQILDAMHIPIIMLDGYEADDVIGTIAKQAEKEDFTVYMVTPDKDYGQLVSDKIFMYKPSRQGNGIEILGVPEILETWSIDRPEQVIDSLGLIGDSVDNIPGVPGIGPKTAVTLLKEYGTLENVLANADKIKGKNGEKIRDNAEKATLSKYLATIKLDVPIHFDATAYQIDPMDKPALKEIFTELEFRSLAVQILGEQNSPAPASGQMVQGNLFDAPMDASTVRNTPAPKEEAPNGERYAIGKKNITNTPHEYHVVDTPSELQALLQKLAAAPEISFDTETTGLDVHQEAIVGMVFAIKTGEAYYVPVPADQEAAHALVAQFKPILEDPSKKIIGQNIKFDATIMKWYGVELTGHYFDTMIAHYLCEPDQRHKLDILSETYLDYKMVPIEELIGSGKKQITMREVPMDQIKEYAGEDADITLQLKPTLETMLQENELQQLYHDIEMPLINVLRDMEYEGVRINPDFLRDYSKTLEQMIATTEEKIFALSGMPFNIASPKQVGEILFDHMKIPYRWKKTSTGQYSTDVEKLAEMEAEHEIVREILNHRKYSKLKSTYVDALPLLVNPRTGRVHSNFNQARAATGRLSSENPNLQNIPIKNDEGREIRKAFEPRDEQHILMAADYSQIELRLIAEISKDQTMLEAFSEGNDFHRATAAKVYGVALADVTPEQRRNAKTVNFSIIYGAGSTNLSRQLGISRAEAKTLIDNYFAQFTGLKTYMDEIVEFARRHGYVSTLVGRRRQLRDINSRNSLASSNAERMAINTPIQGTAADMIKIAMIKIHAAIREAGLRSRMIMQVHDELVFDVHRSEVEQMKSLVTELMRTALPNISVPILVEVGLGENWLEAH